MRKALPADPTLGGWLHYPTAMGVNDVREAFQAGAALVEPSDSRGQEGDAIDVAAGPA
jgi:hypothetical protein